MFCPKCATQNLEGASFCRSCGANISLVPQALTGQLPEAVHEELEGSRDARRRKRHSGPPTVSEGIRHTFMGMGFIVLAAALALFGSELGGKAWWFWMLIPAFIFLGKGIGQIVQVKQQSKSLPQPSASPAIPSPHPLNVLPSRNTAELVRTPPSVTEGTTRHLGAEAPTRHLGAEREER